MPTIVISGVNLKEGGILSILTDCLSTFKQLKVYEYNRIVVLVHSKELIKDFLDVFETREFPEIKASWRKRLQFEFSYSKKLSDEIKPDLWISLHDITPKVNCKFQVVYCHNPSPFYKLPLKDYWLNYKFTLFNAFYGYLYGINIKKNRYVIVQQNWLRKEFFKRYGVKTIVAYPQFDDNPVTTLEQTPSKEKTFTFFYPSYPRVFKNFEVILKAVEILSAKRSDFKVILTIDGTENLYSKILLKKYGTTANVEFIGLQSREKVYELYKESDYLLFPSKLETWGMPVSEAKSFNKPILIADLEYAHESVGDYKSAKFFDPENFAQLSTYMNDAIDAKLKFDLNQYTKPDFPFFDNWQGLIKFLIKEIN